MTEETDKTTPAEGSTPDWMPHEEKDPTADVLPCGCRYEGFNPVSAAKPGGQQVGPLLILFACDEHKGGV